MELDELKSAWNKFSSDAEAKQHLSEDAIKLLLQKRTLDISEKIGRNIRIGIGIVLGWVCLGIGMDVILSPVLDKMMDKPYLTQELMFWAFILEAATYLLIFSAIIVFWVRYNRVEKEQTDSTNLKATLSKLIKVVNSYRKMFNVILVLLLFYVSAAFTSGFFMEYNYQVKETGIDVHNLTVFKWIVIVLAFTIALALCIGFYYLLFTFFYKRLYGRYLKQLKKTYRELTEVVSD